MALRYDTITFLSDYGLVDEFVGVVHSVIRSIAPDVGIVDLTHHVEPYDVRAGGLTLARSAPYLCPGVVLAVVDPSVGTGRRPVAVEVGEGASVLVGPDNGLLAPAVALCGGATRAVELVNEDFQLETDSATFDGRDIFGPAAAHLCLGVDLAELGPPVDPVTLMPGMIPLSREDDGALLAEVLWVDRYGNVQLNVDPEELEGFDDVVAARVGDTARSVRRARTFAEVEPGEIGLVADSYGLMALVCDRRSAAAELGVRTGTEVAIEPLDGEARSGVSTPVELGRRQEGGS